MKIRTCFLTIMITLTGAGGAWASPDKSGELMKKGEKLYQEFSCIACHGAKGEGMDGPFLSSEAFKKKYPKDSDLKKVIINGLPPKEGQTNVMVGLGDTITEEELKALVDYIRSFKPADASMPANHQH